MPFVPSSVLAPSLFMSCPTILAGIQMSQGFMMEFMSKLTSSVTCKRVAKVPGRLKCWLAWFFVSFARVETIRSKRSSQLSFGCAALCSRRRRFFEGPKLEAAVSCTVCRGVQAPRLQVFEKTSGQNTTIWRSPKDAKCVRQKALFSLPTRTQVLHASAKTK